MITDNFFWADNFVVEREVRNRPNGGYTNDPDDPGGETKWGISKRAFPDEDIKNMTKERSQYLRRRNYWDVCRCGALPRAWSLVVYDAAINMGPSVAIRMTQEALGVDIDGIMGDRTIDACYAATEDELEMAMVIRDREYRRRNGFQKYGNGWVKRIFGMAMEIGGIK